MKSKALRCDICGHFIPYDDFDSHHAMRTLITPDTEFSVEDYETLCRICWPIAKAKGVQRLLGTMP